MWFSYESCASNDGDSQVCVCDTMIRVYDVDIEDDAEVSDDVDVSEDEEDEDESNVSGLLDDEVRSVENLFSLGLV